MILARLSGGPLARTGVIAGMSGSPVYIDGKLLGAVAFSFPFATEPIAGIQPIHQMLNLLDQKGTGTVQPRKASSGSFRGVSNVLCLQSISKAGGWNSAVPVDAAAIVIKRQSVRDQRLPDVLSSHRNAAIRLRRLSSRPSAICFFFQRVRIYASPRRRKRQRCEYARYDQQD